MSWRKGIIELGYKRNSYKSFKSCKKKERRLSKQIDTYKSGVFKGTHGFVQRNKLLEKDSIYRNFNIKHSKLKPKDIRCGVIAFNPGLTKVLCVCNRCMYTKFGIEQWGLPKGHMEKLDRVYSKCASRELYEETGVKYNILQDKFVFKRINNTIYYPIIIKEDQKLNQIDKNEILKVEWKHIDELMKEDVTTRYQNQDMKVFLHRYFHDTKKLANKNNEEHLNSNKLKKTL